MTSYRAKYDQKKNCICYVNSRLSFIPRFLDIWESTGCCFWWFTDPGQCWHQTIAISSSHPLRNVSFILYDLIFFKYLFFKIVLLKMLLFFFVFSTEASKERVRKSYNCQWIMTITLTVMLSKIHFITSIKA